MDKYKLFDSEFRLMQIIWENEPINSTALSKICFNRLGWKKSTTFNMVRTLKEKGFIQNNNATVTSMVKSNQIAKYRGEQIVKEFFNGSLSAFVVVLLNGKEVNTEEVDIVKKILNKANDS